MQTNATVPNTPLKISKGLLFPQGFKFFLFIKNDVIDKLNNDLKNTNSYIGILLSIFFTQTVIRLKARAAPTRLMQACHSLLDWDPGMTALNPRIARTVFLCS